MQHDFPKHVHTARSILKSLRSHKVILFDGVLSWKDASVACRWYLPSVLSEFQDALTGGQLGVAKVLEKTYQRFYWMGQRHDIEEWCTTCTVCGAQTSPMKH